MDDGATGVGRLEPQRIAEATRLLALSFDADPNMAYLFPDARRRPMARGALFAASLRSALPDGHVYAALDGGALAGVAVWRPPGAFPLSVARQVRVLPDVLRLLARAPRQLPRAMRFAAAAARRHPSAPHWYLEVVGVAPGFQGRGIGTRLLAPGLLAADRSGIGAYLETSRVATAAWYRTLGFTLLQEGVHFSAAGPPVLADVAPAPGGYPAAVTRLRRR